MPVSKSHDTMSVTVYTRSELHCYIFISECGLEHFHSCNLHIMASALVVYFTDVSQYKTTILYTHISCKSGGIKTKQNKLCIMSLRANYIDLAAATLVPTFADRRCLVVSATDPHGRILGFLDRSRYFFFQVAPQLYSRG
jgi:hypothetical protein